MTTSVGLLPGLLADLADESASLDALVADLPPEGWATPTPAEGWTVAHQIAHLAWTDDQALLSVRSPDEFGGALRKAAAQSGDVVDDGAQAGATLAPTELLRRWRQGRADLVRELDGAARGGAAALVRPTDVGRLPGHRPADGDLGPRAGRGRRAGPAPTRHPPDPACRASRRADPGLLLRGPRPGAAARRVPGRADRPGPRGVDLGAGRLRASA